MSFAAPTPSGGHQFVAYEVSEATSELTLENQSPGTFRVDAILKYNESTEQYEAMPEAQYAVDPTEATSQDITIEFANSQPTGTKLKIKVWRSSTNTIDVNITAE